MAALIKAMGAALIAAAVLVAAVAPPVEAAISCDLVNNHYLRPCLGYVTNRLNGGPPRGCCDGVKRLYNAARTTADRQSVCRCLKIFYSSHSGVNIGKAAGLPRLCGVNIPYKISPSIDCSSVRRN